MSNGLKALRDRKPAAPIPPPAPASGGAKPAAKAAGRDGKKAITGYFSPEMSLALNLTARKHGKSLQAAMGEAFDLWLRAMGESPIGG